MDYPTFHNMDNMFRFNESKFLVDNIEVFKGLNKCIRLMIEDDKEYQ